MDKPVVSSERDNSLRYWDEFHTEYERSRIVTDGWLDRWEPLINDCQGLILDLGCGSGNDTLYFIEHGKKVVACDQSPRAIDILRKNFPEVHEARCLNFLDGFDWEAESFEIICADLCLHYFSGQDTREILRELNRILTSGGYLFVRVNSVKDVLHGAGEGIEVEKHLYRTNQGMLKRFFDQEDIEEFFSEFEILFCEEEDMNRYSRAKVVYTLCLKKKS